MKKLFLLSLMAILLPLAALADGLTVKVLNEGGSVVYNGTDTKNALQIAVYAGEDEATPLVENTDYQLLYSEEVKDVKEGYTVQAIGINGYLGKSGQTTFAVTKKPVNVKLDLKDKVEKTYGELDAVLLEKGLVVENTSILAPGDTWADFISCLTVTRNSDDKGETAGEHKVMVVGNADATSNYDYSATSTGSYATIVIKQKELPVTINLTTRVYNGVAVNLQTLVDEFCKIDDEDIVSWSEQKDEVNVTKLEIQDEDVTELKNAGTYHLLATLSNDNYVAKVSEFTIGKNTLTITAKEAGDEVKWEATYGDKDIPADLTEQFSFIPTEEVKPTAESAETIGLSMVRENTNSEAAGKYKVYPYYKDSKLEVADYKTAVDNYEIVYEKVQEYAINGKQIDADDIEIDVNPDWLTYQGKDFEIPDSLITVTDGKTLLTEGTDYTLAIKEADTKAKDAGDTFVVTVTGKGNYAGTKDTEEQTITRATLNITITEENAAKLTKVYGEADPELTDLYVFDKLLEEADEQPKLTMVRNGVGRNEDVTEDGYIVNVVLDGKAISGYNYKDGTVLKNYDIEYNRSAYKFYITPRTVKYWIEDYTKAYSGTNQTWKNQANYKVDAETEGEGFVNEESFTNIDGAVAPQISLAVTARNVNEEGYEMVVTNADAVTAGANYKVEYVSDNDGKYYITQATLTIVTKNQTVNYGEALPEFDVRNTDYITFSGWKTADKETIYDMTEFKLDEEALAGKVGVYDIVAEVVEPTDKESDEHTIWNNYKYTYKTVGKLTIVGQTEITLDRAAVDAESISALLAAYNGQTVDVVLGGDRNLQADYWYAWTFPFETTVPQISNAFDYAVVDVPNLANSDAGVVSFKLQVNTNTIEPNTLVLIKIAEERNLAEKPVKFTAKEIVYNGPDYAVEDNAGNEYHAIYEYTELSEYGQWYLAGGTFYDAGKYYANYGTPVPQQALAGYVKAAAGSAARILVEEADGSTTVINSVNADKANAAEGWYTVGGVKLNAEPTEKGVYINNGKKVVIK